jgi:fibronectin-binding autotransporter adhesin
MAAKQDGKRARRTWMSILSAVALGESLLRPTNAATTVTWTGTTDGKTWTTGTNWNGNSAPTSAEAAYFASGTYSSPMTLGASTSIGTITFDTGTPTTLQVDGGATSQTLTVAGIGTGNDLIDLTSAYSGTIDFAGTTNSTTLALTLSGSGNIDVANAASTLEIDANIAETGGAETKDGAGTLDLTGTSTFTGTNGWTISAGTLAVSTIQATGNSTIATTIGAGTLDWTAGNNTLASGRSFALTSASSTVEVALAATNLIVDGPFTGTGTLNKTGAGTLTLADVDTFSGGLTISGGVVSVDNVGPLGNVSNTTTLSGGSLLFAAGTPNPLALASTRGFVVNSSSSNDIDVNSGTVNIEGLLSSVVANTGTLNINALSSSDTGTLEISNGSNTYSGVYVAQHGTLEVGAGASLGAVPSSPITDITLYPGTTFQFAGNVINSPLDPNRGIAIGSPAAGGTASFDVASTNEVVIDGVIADNTGGSGTLNKVDTGTLILTGSSTYSGGTSVTAGILNIDGALTSTSNAVTVSSSATLGGVGSIAGAVTVNNGGNIAPGEPDAYNAADANPGPFNAAAKFGMLTVGSAAISGTLQISENDSMSPNVDVLDALGALNISSATVNFTVTGTPAQPAYVFAEYGSLTGTFATVDNLPSGYTINYDYQGDDEIALVAVPEPASGAGAILLTTALLFRRKNKK